MSLVNLSNVVKTFGDVAAVDDVSFSIDRGEVVGFLGPNGAGKTTTMRLITQILEPDSGTIEIDGHPVEDGAREQRSRVGYLPETNPLYTDMLVGEYLDYIGEIRGMSAAQRRARAEAVVPQTGLEEKFYTPIDQLSKGFRQRVGLAQAILAEPEILILDEPTEGLDPNQRVEIRALIREIGAARTVLLSTHVMQEVQLTCSRVLIIHRGGIIADGSVESLLAEGEGAVRVSVELEAPGPEAAASLEALETVAVVESAAGAERGRSRFTVIGASGRDPRSEIFSLAAGRDWTLWELHLQQRSLEDVFHSLTSEPAADDRADEDPADVSGQAMDSSGEAIDVSGDATEEAR